MHNWNTDTKILKKNPEEYAVWKLEQLINFGLDKEEALAFLLWQKRS